MFRKSSTHARLAPLLPGSLQSTLPCNKSVFLSGTPSVAFLCPQASCCEQPIRIARRRAITGAVGQSSAIADQNDSSFDHALTADFKMRWSVRWPLYVLFYAVLLNVPFWLAASTNEFMMRGWFCIPFALLGILCLFLPSVFAPFLVLLLIGTDIVNAICQTYYLSPSQLLSNMDGATDFSLSRIVCMGLVLLLALALAAASRYLALRPGESRNSAILVLLLLGFGLIGIDYAQAIRDNHAARLSHGSIVGDSFNAGHFSRPRLSRTPLRSLILYRDMLDPQIAGVPTTPQPAPAAFTKALQRISFAMHPQTGPQPDIVLVLVESWGWPTTPRCAMPSPRRTKRRACAAGTTSSRDKYPSLDRPWWERPGSYAATP